MELFVPTEVSRAADLESCCGQPARADRNYTMETKQYIHALQLSSKWWADNCCFFGST